MNSGHLPAPISHDGGDSLWKLGNFLLSKARDLDFDLGSGHTAYLHASQVDLYLHAKFHWNRRNFLWTDVRTGGRTFDLRLALLDRLGGVDLKMEEIKEFSEIKQKRKDTWAIYAVSNRIGLVKCSVNSVSVITHSATTVARVSFSPASVCLSARYIETDAARTPHSTYKCSAMSPGNALICGSQVNVTSQKTGAGVGLCTLVSAGFF